MKIPQCDSCQFYSNDPHLVCGVHSDGVDTRICMDYRRNPEYQEPEVWCPEGYCYYNGELIKLPEKKLSKELQLWILENHPSVTGKCPECGYEFTERLKEYWDCPECGFAIRLEPSWV